MTIAATGEIGTEAANTGIEDLGDYYTGTNVEVALQEIGYTLDNLAVTGDLVTLEDLGEYYPVHNVEDALQQVGFLLAAKAPLSSPEFTDIPTAPTAVSGTNTTQLATTAFVQQEIDANAYVLPTDVVQDSSYVHTDNNYTTTEKNKLSGIATGANKYVLPTDVVQDSSYVHTDNNYTTTEKK